MMVFSVVLYPIVLYDIGALCYDIYYHCILYSVMLSYFVLPYTVFYYFILSCIALEQMISRLDSTFDITLYSMGSCFMSWYTLFITSGCYIVYCLVF